MRTSSLPPIPWQHSSEDFGSVWLWETPHFVVTVNGNDRSCYYTISDKSHARAGTVRLLSDGQSASFEQAELLIRETLGKSYHPSLNYQHYAGPLATTFRLADGRDLDLAPYVDELVRVTVLNRDGSRASYEGRAKVENYDLLLANDEGQIRISPSFIADIALSGVGRKAVPQNRLDRTVKGKMQPGCTGTPGFILGTVEHTGRDCPIHENH